MNIFKVFTGYKIYRKTITVCLLYALFLNASAKDMNADSENVINQEIAADSSALNPSDSVYLDTSLKLVVFRLQSEIIDLTRQLRIYQQFIFILFLIIASLSMALLLSPLKKIFFTKFPQYPQKKGYNAGLVCLQMVLRHYGKKTSYRRMKRKVSDVDFSTLNLIEFAKLSRQYGLEVKVVSANFDELLTDIHIPVVLCFNSHTAVLYKLDNQYAYLADPFYGLIRMRIYYFLSVWYTDYSEAKGVAMVLYPGSEFGKKVSKKKQMNKLLTIKELKDKEMAEYQVG